MQKIFMSYRRKSWPFTDRLADELRQRLDADVFVDFTGIDEDDFERSILRNLRESDVVLLVISEHTFSDRIQLADDWVRREIRETLKLDKPLILVCIDGLLPPPDLPDDIKDVTRKQGINFYSEYFTPAVMRLVELIVKILAIRSRPIVSTSPDAPPSKPASLLSGLFEWIEIPSGKVTIEPRDDSYLKQKTVFDIPSFAIAKYSVTNAQYARFIDAEGYSHKEWWTDAGWNWRERARKIEPFYWHDKMWNGGDQPVVGVSWYEAVAFCLWLSETLGEKIMLPTEQQWQRAAQGDDNRIYPWGSEWDGNRCNNSVRPFSSSQTTPVQQYKGIGDSPFGVVELTGNIWERCLTIYQSGDTSLAGVADRVMRGGSWSDNSPVGFLVTFRNKDNPEYRNNVIGFRCARSI